MSEIAVSRRRHLAWMVALVVVLATGWWMIRTDSAGAGAPAPQGIDVVYVSVSTNFPDSLGIGPGAALYGAPVILVPTDPPIPGVTATELERLDPKRVVIVGGTAVVSSAMEDVIADLLPGATIERLAGANRYATNTQFTESVFPYEVWVSVPASAFAATAAGDVALGSCCEVSNSAGGMLFAPLTLPHGAEILEMSLTGVDNDAGMDGPGSGNDARLYLVRESELSSSSFVCGAESSGAPGAFTVSCLVGSIRVDNEHWAYSVMVEGADGDPLVRFVSVRYRVGAPTADPDLGP